MTYAIDGGITAPLGFRASGVACGIKRRAASGQPALDLALVATDGSVPAAAVFTTNRAVAAPVIVSREHLARSEGHAAAIVINSGCANACTGQAGHDVARQMAEATAKALGCPVDHVLVASTGVIGVDLDIQKIRTGVTAAARSLGPDGAEAATRAIMTTDPFPKALAVEVETPRGRFKVGGMAKGSGMIEPRMATMIGVLTTDAAVAPALLARALRQVCDETFNAITVDGDSSTNDCVFVMASGRSGVTFTRADAPELLEGLRAVAGHLAREIVRGGEGATKLVSITVTGAASRADAERAARTVANSLLVKTAIHGGDPNWGRLIAAAGRSGAEFALDQASVTIGEVPVFVNGVPHDDRAPDAARILSGRDIPITIDLGRLGTGTATMWTCDLSAEYVRINGEYRT